MRDVHVLDPEMVRGTRDLSPEVLDEDGRIRVLPAAYWATTTVRERILFGHRHAAYLFPTVELVDQLRGLIAGRPAIEVGAGNGVLAEALGIPATDNRMQEKEPVRSWYAERGLPAVRYGPNVVEAHASRAVRRFRPEVVIGCWVSHKSPDGNPLGLDEEDILRHCRLYIVVGNEYVHRGKLIWKRPHTIEHPPYLYSRAGNGSREFIAWWPGAA